MPSTTFDTDFSLTTLSSDNTSSTMRQKLIAPYLSTEVWLDLAAAVDEVFEDTIDRPILSISKLRDLINLYGFDSKLALDPRDRFQKGNKNNIFDLDIYRLAQTTGQIFKSEDLIDIEKNTLISLANFLGFQFPYSDLFDVASYKRIVGNISNYYPDKGKFDFVSFLSYCMNVILRMDTYWTTNYTTFVEEDPLTQTPVYNGGTWYPTTHVSLTYDAEAFNNIDLNVLKYLFYYLSPINLVLWKIIPEILGRLNCNIAMSGLMEVFITFEPAPPTMEVGAGGFMIVTL